MGGDGGVIASNRKYMRGAGTADHTGDLNRHAAQKFNAREVMTTCALTKRPLHTSSSSSVRGSTLVADPYGSLYHKEAAIQALLTRKQQGDDSGTRSASTTIGPQVRRLADLYEVRFYREEGSKNLDPTCPITGKALTGNIPAILLVPGKEGVSNVVSESALSQLSPEEFEAEYGHIRKRVRLAPNPILLEEIKEQLQQEREKDEEERRKAKKEKKKDKKSKSKRKRDGTEKGSFTSEKKRRSDENKGKKHSETSTRSGSGVKSSSTVGKRIQSRVDSAIEKSSVLSSLFTNKAAQSKISEKEKKDNLFAR